MTTNIHAFSPYLGDIEAIKSSPASARKAETAQAAFTGYIDNVKNTAPNLVFRPIALVVSSPVRSKLITRFT